MALREWAQKALSRESAEEGAKTGVVRLSSSDTNTTWETWTAPFPDVETFLQEAEAVKGQIAEECPVRRVPLMFTAEKASGATIAQYPTSIQGKNRQADALAGSGNNAAKAFAEAMEGISRVVVATLKSAEVQIGSLTKTLESQATQIHDLIEYERVKQKLELTEKQDNNGANRGDGSDQTNPAHDSRGAGLLARVSEKQQFTREGCNSRSGEDRRNQPNQQSNTMTSGPIGLSPSGPVLGNAAGAPFIPGPGARLRLVEQGFLVPTAAAANVIPTAPGVLGPAGIGAGNGQNLILAVPNPLLNYRATILSERLEPVEQRARRSAALSRGLHRWRCDVHRARE